MKNHGSRCQSAALVSVHDVMPETLPRVMDILRFLEKHRVFPATLLVVPGRDWTAGGIKELRALQDSGYELAGHGWRHRAEAIFPGWHRLHSLLISGNEAEHLSLSAETVVNRIKRNYRWFASAGLDAPLLYVPPAWALGRVRKDTLKTLPFRYYETLTGLFDAHKGSFHLMPLAGYMADTAFRKNALTISNLVNRLPVPVPMRIAVHPDDLSLPLAGELKAQLHRCRRFITCSRLECL